MSLRTPLLGILISLLAFPGAAAAQLGDPCSPDPTRGPLEVTPASGAGGVTLDSPVKLRYSEGYFDDPGAIVAVELFDEFGSPVAGETQIHGDVVFFIPDQLLDPSSFYEGTAYGLDRDLAFNFFTGTGLDLEAPRFGDIVEIDSTSASDVCDDFEGGYRIDVRFRPAIDDGAPGSIEYLLYLVRGPTVELPELRARARNINTELFTMAFVISPEEAVSPICVQVHAIDGTGKIDGDGNIACIEPIQGKFFEPLCDVGGAPGLASGGAMAFGSAFAFLVLLVRRRRI